MNVRFVANLPPPPLKAKRKVRGVVMPVPTFLQLNARIFRTFQCIPLIKDSQEGRKPCYTYAYSSYRSVYRFESPKGTNSNNSVTSGCGGSGLGINGGIINNWLYRAVPSKRKRNPSTVKKHKNTSVQAGSTGVGNGK